MKLTKEYLEKNNIDYTILEDGHLSVSSSLYLRGTKITSLPKNLSVGGYLYLRGTKITSLPENISVSGISYRGELSGYRFDIIDSIPCVVLSEKSKEDITIKYCQRTKMVNGKFVGDKFYVASCNDYNAHGDTLKEAMEELAFKTANRDIEEYRCMPLDTVKTPSEWAFIYRMITGACRYGTEQFIKSKKLKESYTLSEIIEETKGAYGHEIFTDTVIKGKNQ